MYCVVNAFSYSYIVLLTVLLFSVICLISYIFQYFQLYHFILLIFIF